MKYFVGCDLGGTNLRAAIVNPENGSVSHLTSVPTLAREGHDAVIGRMVRLIQEVILKCGVEMDDLGGIGIGVPGVCDLEHGLTVFLPNLYDSWLNVPLRDMISQKVGLPTFILNDARAITYGEWCFGAGRGVNTMACFTLGTGVGGGLVINRQLHLGIGGEGGELGHQTIDYNGPVCGCGNRGCLEAYASGPAISAMAFKAITQGRTTCLGEMVGFDLNKITPEVVADAARKGDSIACEIYEQVGMYLGIAIANVLVSVGPKKVVLAGGVAAANELLLNPIRSTIKMRVRIMPVEQVEIVLAELGNNAGVIGVSLWAASRL